MQSLPVPAPGPAGRRLVGEVVRVDDEGEGRKLGREIRVQELIDPLRLEQVAQPVSPRSRSSELPQAVRHGSMWTVWGRRIWPPCPAASRRERRLKSA